MDLEPLVAAAEEIAGIPEKRYRDQKSKAWERLCQGSLAGGGKKVLCWIATPERGLQTPTHEAPGMKLAPH